MPDPAGTGWTTCADPSSLDPETAAIEIARHINQSVESLRSAYAPHVILIFFPTRWNAFLERLASDNFLDIKILNDVLYLFNPVTPALSQAAARCIDSYRRERIAMTKIVTAATIRPMRDFAEAFQIEKTKSDG